MIRVNLPQLMTIQGREFMTVEFLLEDLSLVSKENSEITSPCIYCISQVYKTFQVALLVKNPPANSGDIRDADLIPGLGRSSERRHGNTFRYCCLENLMDRGAWRAIVQQGRKKSDTTEAT